MKAKKPAKAAAKPATKKPTDPRRRGVRPAPKPEAKPRATPGRDRVARDAKPKPAATDAVATKAGPKPSLTAAADLKKGLTAVKSEVQAEPQMDAIAERPDPNYGKHRAAEILPFYSVTLTYAGISVSEDIQGSLEGLSVQNIVEDSLTRLRAKLELPEESIYPHAGLSCSITRKDPE